MFKKQLFYMSLETSIHYKNDDDKLIEIGCWRYFKDWTEVLNRWCEKNNDEFEPKKFKNTAEFVQQYLPIFEEIYRNIRFTVLDEYNNDYEKTGKQAYAITHDDTTYTLYDSETLNEISFYFHESYYLNDKTANKLYALGDNYSDIPYVINNNHASFQVCEMEHLLKIRKVLLFMQNNTDKEYWVINSY